MKFQIKQDIEAPIDFVFEQMTDFKAFERAAMRRGAEVQRVKDGKNGAIGTAWDARFQMRGKERDIQIEVTEHDSPNRIVVSSRAPAMGGDLVVELMSLSRNRTRVDTQLQLAPRNLTAKLLVQSLKLARKNVTQRLNDRLASYAVEVEARYKKSA
ncbi:MAG: SRPBCC family protein [Pseudomonadota bacterium]